MNTMITTEAKLLAKVAPKIMGAFHRIPRPHHHGEALTMRQHQAMLIVKVSEQITISGLCDQLGLAPSTGTELVNRMIDLGFFIKCHSTPDRRQFCLKLSALGDEILKKRQDDMVAMFEQLLAPLNDKDRLVLTQSFEAIWDILQRYY